MIQVNIHEAKAKLSQLLARVEAGEDVIIARAGHPIARISGINLGYQANARGTHTGTGCRVVRSADDFNAPLPEDLLNEFER